jgi:hypothetical protein
MNRDAEDTPDDPVVVRVMAEVEQGPSVRRPLIAALEERFGGRCVLLYFTSFVQPVIIEDADADLIESVLQKSGLKGGLTMVINSPGGDGLAAERIINVCRSYAWGDFEVVVPKMAKSAATMICFGARKVWMSRTSELGSIDPQVLRGNRLLSASTIVKSYDELLEAAAHTKGHLEPYLQQLSHYDASEIDDLRTAQRLSESIAVTALQTGMMKGISPDEIRRKIRPFLDPQLTLAHGRRIGLDVAQQCGLSVAEVPLGSEAWSLVWELYIRTDWCVTNQCSKLVLRNLNPSFLDVGGRRRQRREPTLDKLPGGGGRSRPRRDRSHPRRCWWRGRRSAPGAGRPRTTTGPAGPALATTASPRSAPG